MIFLIKKSLCAGLMICSVLAPHAGAGQASAESLEGVYRGFLAFDLKGKEIRESLMEAFGANGTVILVPKKAKTSRSIRRPAS